MNYLTKDKRKLLTPALGIMCLSAAALSGCASSSGDAYNIDWNEDIAGTTIKFWTPFGSTLQQTLETDFIKPFEEKYNVTVECESQNGYSNLLNAVTLAASTNSYPELTLAYPDHEASYEYSDILVKLDYYFENDPDAANFKISDFYTDYMTENQALLYKDDGTPYTLGVPFNKSTEVLVYNKTFFDWASKYDSAIVVPTTWDEVRTVGTHINSFMTKFFGKVAGSDGNAYSKGDTLPTGVTSVFDFSSVTSSLFHPLSYDSQANYFITTCRQWGGEYTYYDKDDQKGYLAFDSDEVRNGLSWMQETYNNKEICTPDDFTGDSSKYSSSYFKDMLTVMSIGSSAGVANNAPAADKFKVGIAPIPYKDSDKKYVISQGTNLVLLNTGTSAQRLTAWKLLKYLAKESNGLWAAESGYFPSCEYAVNSTDYQSFITGKLVSTVDEINYATAMTNQNYYMKSSENWTKFVDAPFNGSATVRSTVEGAMKMLFIDKKTPDEVIKSEYASLRDYVK